MNPVAGTFFIAASLFAAASIASVAGESSDRDAGLPARDNPVQDLR